MERWISFLQSYDEILIVAAAAVLGLAMAVMLGGIFRQIKKLNKSLLSITGNVQAYFDVIMQEDSQAQDGPQEPGGEPLAEPADRHMEQARALAEEQRKQEEEEVFNSVLQEYFS